MFTLVVDYEALDLPAPTSDEKKQDAALIIALDAEVRRIDLRDQPTYMGGWFTDWLVSQPD